MASVRWTLDADQSSLPDWAEGDLVVREGTVCLRAPFHLARQKLDDYAAGGSRSLALTPDGPYLVKTGPDSYELRYCYAGKGTIVFADPTEGIDRFLSAIRALF